MSLEFPSGSEEKRWASLYRARGDEVSLNRPVFTGDVYTGLRVFSLGEEQTRDVLLVQHPCALRINGSDLVPRLIAVEVKRHNVIAPEAWDGYYSLMPLPEIYPSIESGKANQAAFFDKPLLLAAADVDTSKRVACLSQFGINLLLQRWVHHNSRACIPTTTYQEVTSPVVEEADLIEEWADERVSEIFSVSDSFKEVMHWLRDDLGSGVTRQKKLEDAQSRSTVRREMRAELRKLRES